MSKRQARDPQVAPVDGSEAAERAFVARVAAVLDEEVGALDGATRSRLRQARAKAMARRAQGDPWRWLRRVERQGPLGAAIAASVLALLAVPVLMDRSAGPAPGPAEVAVGPVDALEIVLNVDSLEMLEDLEFFEWLAAEPGMI